MSEEQIQEGTQASEEIQDETQHEQIVTEELAEKLGVSKTLVGKPIDELGKSLRALQTDYAKTKSKLKEVEKSSKKEAEKPNLKAPDPLNFESDDDYQRALDDYIDRRFAEKMQPLQKDIVAQKQQAVMNAIQKELPQGMKLEEVAQEWMESVGFQEGDEMLFQGNPKIIQNAIVGYAKAKKLQEIQGQLDKESGDLALEKIRKSLGIQSKDFDLNSVERSTKKTNGVVSRILARQERELKLQKLE